MVQPCGGRGGHRLCAASNAGVGRRAAEPDRWSASVVVIPVNMRLRAEVIRGVDDLKVLDLARFHPEDCVLFDALLGAPGMLAPFTCPG